MSVDREIGNQEELKEITPPAGVIMHHQTLDQNGDPINHFGLEKCKVGNISLQREVVLGTLLRFAPGPIRIGVARQDLSADEINTVGQLGLDLLESQYYVAMTGREVDLVEQLKNEVPVSLILGGRVMRSQIEERLGDFGAFANSLRASQKEQGVKFDELVDKLDTMGVLYVNAGPMSGVSMKAELDARARSKSKRGE